MEGKAKAIVLLLIILTIGIANASHMPFSELGRVKRSLVPVGVGLITNVLKGKKVISY